MTTASEVSAMHKMFGIKYSLPGDFGPMPQGWTPEDWSRHCRSQADYKNNGQYRAALMRIFRDSRG